MIESELTQENTGGAEERVSIEDALDRYGRILWNCKGQSMEPLIREATDHVVIEKPREEIEPYDVVMYSRDATGDARPDREYVLHRVIERNGDEFIILGDNCVTYEHVPADRVIGVMTGLIRSGKPYDFASAGYRAYMDLWIRPRRLRVFLTRVRFRLKRMFAKAT